jgi:hypothetical protein
MSNSLDSAPVIFRYTRRMALADGVLVDATQGEFAAVSREHFPDYHLALTSAVFALVREAVESASGSDFAGVWHDILWMSRVCPVRLLPGGHTFKVGVRAGSHLRWHELKILFHGGNYGEPCATVMLPDEG